MAWLAALTLACVSSCITITAAKVVATEYIWRPSTTCNGSYSTAVEYPTGVCVEDEAIIFCNKSPGGSWTVSVVTFTFGTSCSTFLASRIFPGDRCNPGNRSGNLYSYNYVCSERDGPSNEGAGGGGGKRRSTGLVVGETVATCILAALASAAAVVAFIWWKRGLPTAAGVRGGCCSCLTSASDHSAGVDAAGEAYEALDLASSNGSSALR